MTSNTYGDTDDADHETVGRRSRTFVCPHLRDDGQSVADDPGLIAQARRAGNRWPVSRPYTCAAGGLQIRGHYVSDTCCSANGRACADDTTQAHSAAPGRSPTLNPLPSYSLTDSRAWSGADAAIWQAGVAAARRHQPPPPLLAHPAYRSGYIAGSHKDCTNVQVYSI